MDFPIYYVFPLDDSADTLLKTVFMGFTPGVTSIPNRLLAVLHCPSHLNALEHSPEMRAKFKLAGTFEHSLVPLNKDLLGSLFASPENPLFVILSEPGQDLEVKEALKSMSFPILHLTSSIVEQIHMTPQYADVILREHVRTVAHYLRQTHPDISFHLDTVIDKKVAPESGLISNYVLREHGVTIPNEIPLVTLRIKFPHQERLISSVENDYVKAICDSATELKGHRTRLLNDFPENFEGPTVDLIIACPGLVNNLWSSSKVKKFFERRRRDKVPKFGSLEQIRKALSFCARQEGYTITTTGEELSEMQSNPAYHFFVQQWMREITAFTAFLAFQSYTDFCPVIRLPRRINRIRSRLRQLGEMLRSQTHSSKLSRHKLARKIVEEMEQIFSQSFISELPGNDSTIRIVADIPIEWCRQNSEPIALSHFTTRVPTTPGNLFSIISVQTQRLFINIEEIDEITVIRSFHSEDRLRNIFEFCLNKYSQVEGWKMKFKFVDVATEQEFIAAMNNVHGPIVIYDGHGSHEATRGFGTLAIGDQSLDIWSLRGRMQVPPIVIMSTCDSFPIDGNHASTASGFLALGAKSVVGTLLPVDAIKSGLMMARLIYRLTTISRSWIKICKTPLSWSKIIGSQIRASYVSEFFNKLLDDEVLTESVCIEAQTIVTIAINTFDSEWMNIFQNIVLEKTQWTLTHLEKYKKTKFFLPDALLYLPLGCPEKIHFVDTSYISGDLGPD